MEAKRTRRTPAEGIGARVGGELVIPGEALVFEDGEWFIVCEDTGYPVESYEGAFLVGPDDEWCRQAVQGARACWCSNSVRFLASITTGKAFALPCLSWSCEKCNRRKWHAARELFRLGIESAWAEEKRVRFLTLTVEKRGHLGLGAGGLLEPSRAHAAPWRASTCTPAEAEEAPNP